MREVINIGTRWIKNGSENTIVTYIGHEEREGVTRARFRAAHGGIVSLTMATFLERYSMYHEPEPENRSALDRLVAQLAKHEYKLQGKYIVSANDSNFRPECPDDCIELYFEVFPLQVEWANGDDIHTVFTEHRPGSCMGKDNDECQQMREVYANNSDQVSAIYWQDDSHGLILGTGSALVWHTAKYVYVDRIYDSEYAMEGGKERLRKELERYAREKFPNLEYGKPEYIDVEHDPSEPLPYIDTFRYAEDSGNGMVRLYREHSSGRTSCVSTSGTVLEHCTCCCNCNNQIDEDCDHCQEGDWYCESCFNEHFSFDEIAEEYVSSDDIAEFTVYTRYNSLESFWTTTDSLYSNYTQCHEDSCVDYVHDRCRIETVDGDYICPDDMENGEWVETEENDVMKTDDAFYYDDAYHTEPESDDEEDSDGDDEEVVAIAEVPNSDDIQIEIQHGDSRVRIPATKVGDCLAVHVRYGNFDTKTYTVTHTPTGLAVYVGLESYQIAIERAAKLLASLAIGGVASGMLTTVNPEMSDPLEQLAKATSYGVTDEATKAIFKHCNATINYSVLATV